MGIGGTSSSGHTASPTTMYAPVSYGGNIVAGDIGSGPIGLSGGSEAGGGSFDFKLDMPMPLPAMQMQNLDFWTDALHVVSPITNIPGIGPDL